MQLKGHELGEVALLRVTLEGLLLSSSSLRLWSGVGNFSHALGFSGQIKLLWGYTSKPYGGSNYYCAKCPVSQVELAGTSSSAAALAFYLHLDENQEVAFFISDFEYSYLSSFKLPYFLNIDAICSAAATWLWAFVSEHLCHNILPWRSLARGVVSPPAPGEQHILSQWHNGNL